MSGATLNDEVHNDEVLNDEVLNRARILPLLLRALLPDLARLPRCAEEFFAEGQAYVALSRVRSLDQLHQTAMYLIRYAYKGSASLQLDAHTHQQEQDEIERLEGSA